MKVTVRDRNVVIMSFKLIQIERVAKTRCQLRVSTKCKLQDLTIINVNFNGSNKKQQQNMGYRV